MQSSWELMWIETRWWRKKWDYSFTLYIQGHLLAIWRNIHLTWWLDELAIYTCMRAAAYSQGPNSFFNINNQMYYYYAVITLLHTVSLFCFRWHDKISPFPFLSGIFNFRKLRRHNIGSLCSIGAAHSTFYSSYFMLIRLICVCKTCC